MFATYLTHILLTTLLSTNSSQSLSA